MRYERARLWKAVNDTIGARGSFGACAVALWEASAFGDGFVSYSRSRAYYDSRTCHPLLSFRKTRAAMDALEAARLIDHQRQMPGGRNWQSAARARPELVALLDDLDQGQPIGHLVCPSNCITLRDDEGRALALPNRREISRLNRPLLDHNQAISSLSIRHENGGLLGAPLTRIFNVDFSRGGRAYASGLSWQNIPAEDRKRISIDGEAVVELDFSAIHPELLYAEAGARPPADCYDLPPWERALVKISLLILINAKTESAARAALADSEQFEAMGLSRQAALATAQRLMDDVKAAHRPIASAFHSDAGARLMRQDSDLAQKILGKLRRRGIVALPVHDSFLVPASKREELETVMREVAADFGMGQIKVHETA